MFIIHAGRRGGKAALREYLCCVLVANRFPACVGGGIEGKLFEYVSKTKFRLHAIGKTLAIGFRYISVPCLVVGVKEEGRDSHLDVKLNSDCSDICIKGYEQTDFVCGYVCISISTNLSETL